MTRHALSNEQLFYNKYQEVKKQSLEKLIPGYNELSLKLKENKGLDFFLDSLRNTFISIVSQFVKIDYTYDELLKSKDSKVNGFALSRTREEKILNNIIRKIDFFEKTNPPTDLTANSQSIEKKLSIVETTYKKIIELLDDHRSMENEIRTLRELINIKTNDKELSECRQTIKQYQLEQNRITDNLMSVLRAVENEDNQYGGDRAESMKKRLKTDPNVRPMGLAYARYVINQMIAIQSNNDETFGTIDERVKSLVKIAKVFQNSFRFKSLESEFNSIDKNIDFYERMKNILADMRISVSNKPTIISNQILQTPVRLMIKKPTSPEYIQIDDDTLLVAELPKEAPDELNLPKPSALNKQLKNKITNDNDENAKIKKRRNN